MDAMLLKTLVWITVLCGLFAASPIEVPLSNQENECISQGNVIVREVPCESKNGKTYEAIGLIEATVSDIYRVLMNFEHHCEFMPNVRRIETVTSDDQGATLIYTLGLPMGITRRYRLLMRFENHGNIAMLKWHKLPWPELKGKETIADTKGYWLLKNYPEKKGHALVVYHVFTDPGHIPLGLGWIARLLTRDSIPDVVKKTRSRVYELVENAGPYRLGSAR